MRVLVEQTESAVKAWLKNLGFAEGIGVHVLMGGEDPTDWDLCPEKDAIFIGTQDMLLSRALNRGYAMSRYRWPVQFGLLNNDCLWVFDEIQLMGSGLATTAQLEAFRTRFWPPARACRSVWMSATLDRRWLRTVDFDPASLRLLKLEKEDLQIEEVRRRFRAKKPHEKARHTTGDAQGLAEEVKKAHRPGTRTVVVLNTVRRARELHSALEKLFKKADKRPEIVLIHSRFRPPDRQDAVRRLLADPGQEGAIIISTQVIEAGVDISAVTLFTELAPWASLVQRFGRCNRSGHDNDKAQVYWIDLRGEKKAQDVARPYALEDLELARKHLRKCSGVGAADLPEVDLPYQHRHLLRSKDLLELFDTTPDLAGNDIDIDRYVREVEESDVRVFWRDWDAEKPPPEDLSRPQREELCPAPLGEFRDFLRALAKRDTRARRAYRWDFLEKTWSPADASQVYPGQVYLLHASAGGYSTRRGWDGKSADAVVPNFLPKEARSQEANDDDAGSEVDRWQSIAEHAEEVCRELDAILGALKIAHDEPLRLAARWHDRGKAHRVFQERILEKRGDEIRPVVWIAPHYGAKAPGKNEQTGDPGWWAPGYCRKHFRHELASALAVLAWPNDALDVEVRNLAAYLVAAHHGKVRLSIRSLPGERMPDLDADDGHERRFARGVWDGDRLPATDLGGGMIAPEARLSLEPMELGLCQSPPFANQPSWAERVLRLRDQLGPFRLAFLEALLRAADHRASRGAD
jgi:CRISPR-associated endonuclease/helicase Cas3